MKDKLVERARFLASGQDDPHSVTIDELCDRIEAQAAALRESAAALQCAKEELALLIPAECLQDGGPQIPADWPVPNEADGECIQSAWDAIEGNYILDSRKQIG
ncbi:hypothetical protein GRI72_03045 [Altererythrobacter marinus]|uniref:Uncharacterized protein n=1 Tax=Pelagerythrobacter marinus TaxID=538382 RepID=A0ABW9USG1_9SPHN|nr:hypothetical protein [Pelagerythrobacter marinus]MXO67809.1 hypothetical protein [Pelagerythrobacter marinus]